MRTTAPPKRLGIVPEALTQRIQRRITLPHVPAQILVVVDTLRAGHDLLPAHEEVVAVAELGVGGVGVRVEGPDAAREFVHGEEVGGVFLGDEAAEAAFLCGGVGEGGV